MEEGDVSRTAWGNKRRRSGLEPSDRSAVYRPTPTRAPPAPPDPASTSSNLPPPAPAQNVAGASTVPRPSRASPTTSIPAPAAAVASPATAEATREVNRKNDEEGPNDSSKVAEGFKIKLEVKIGLKCRKCGASRAVDIPSTILNCYCPHRHH